VTEPRFCMFCGLVLRAMNSFAYGDHSSQKFLGFDRAICSVTIFLRGYLLVVT
jgi:hypothetical protein